MELLLISNQVLAFINLFTTDLPTALALIFSGFFIGAAGIYWLKRVADKNARKQASDITDNAHRDAENIIKEAKISAKEERIKSKEEFEKATKKHREELQKEEKRLNTKEEKLEAKFSRLEKRIVEADKRDQKLRDLTDKTKADSEKLQTMIDSQVVELERIAGLSQDEAKQQLLQDRKSVV